MAGTPKTTTKVKRKMSDNTNPYKPGSLAWRERARYNEVRRILDNILYARETGLVTLAIALRHAESELYAFDTDSISF